MHREWETARHLYLVVSGVVRVFVTSSDGRTMTVRYCRPGALIGAMSLPGTDGMFSVVRRVGGGI
jgi:CRP/FNR family cyclic AMP-dependent transcriptional regulator